MGAEGAFRNERIGQPNDRGLCWVVDGRNPERISLMSWYDRTQGSSPAHDAPPATSVPASSGPAPAGPAPAAPAAAGPTAAGPRRRSKIVIASGAVAVAAILG